MYNVIATRGVFPSVPVYDILQASVYDLFCVVRGYVPLLGVLSVIHGCLRTLSHLHTAH